VAVSGGSNYKLVAKTSHWSAYHIFFGVCGISGIQFLRKGIIIVGNRDYKKKTTIRRVLRHGSATNSWVDRPASAPLSKTSLRLRRLRGRGTVASHNQRLGTSE